MMLFKQMASYVLVLAGLSFWCLKAQAAETSLEFLDPCSRTAVAVAPAGRTQIGVRIEGLKPGERVDAVVQLAPVGPREETIDLLTQREKTHLKVDKNGSVLFGMGAGPERRLRFHPSARLWQATVTWESGAEQGTASNRIYLMESLNQRFYEVVAKDSPICSWRKPIELTSQYHFNRDVYEMKVSQRVPSGLIQSEKGINIGAQKGKTPTTGPLFQSPDQGGWVFPGFREIALQTSLMAETMKTLPIGDGGFFVRKVLYARYQAREYRMIRKNRSCPKWVSEREGYVDVPRVVYDFVSVPQALAENTSAVIKSLEASLPPVKSCSEADGGEGGRMSTAVSTEQDGAPVHFIPVQPNLVRQ